MREMNDIRRDINSVDAAIRELFLLRMSLSREVAGEKARTGGNVYQPEREAEILETRAGDMEDELKLKYTALLQSMIRASREYQYSELLRHFPERFPIHPGDGELNPNIVYYQGVPGAYQELAAKQLFPGCELKNVPTWEQVFQSVRDGKADVGVVPVENTTAGMVSEVYDLLLEYDLFINRSYIKKVSHCLAATPGAGLEDIKCVCSHPHALPQCRSFISKHHFKSMEMLNTALAAKHVSEKNDKSLAAICSEEAAHLYGLDVLAKNVNDIKHNETKFIAVSRQLTSRPEDNRISIAFHLANRPGALDGVLDIFTDYGIDMTEIHSRPLKNSPWSYVFYIDFAGNLNDHSIKSLLYQLHSELPYIKITGTY